MRQADRGREGGWGAQGGVGVRGGVKERVRERGSRTGVRQNGVKDGGG